MKTRNEIECGQLVKTAYQCFSYLEGSLEDFPGLLKRIIEERAWEIFEDRGRIFQFPTLAEMITTSPLHGGWGETIEAVKRAIRDDAEALSMFDAELQRKPGKTWDSRTTENTLDNIQDNSAPTGTSKTAALRRLRTQRPDLHQQVINGKLSAHAAMVCAGFRRKTFTVVADDAVKAVQALRKHYTLEQVITAWECNQ